MDIKWWALNQKRKLGLSVDASTNTSSKLDFNNALLCEISAGLIKKL